MYLMDKMLQLCLCQVKINESKWYEQIKIYKLKKEVKALISELMEEDIFSLSKAFASIMQHISSETAMSLQEYSNISISSSKILLYIDDAVVDYHPLSNRFQITQDNSTYYIYENNRISRLIAKSWNPLVVKIKKLYIQIIIKMSNDLNQPNSTKEAQSEEGKIYTSSDE